MHDDTIYTLVASSNRGRYALSDPVEGHDLTSGEHIALLLGGQWITGHVEHARRLSLKYPHRQGNYSTWDGGIQLGYYFIARGDGAVCGLCTGMQIRLIGPGASHDPTS